MSKEDKGSPGVNILDEGGRHALDLMSRVEGESWAQQQREHANDEFFFWHGYYLVRDLHREVEDAQSLPKISVAEIYGFGGVTRWFVLSDGEIQFSPDHDNVGEKTEKAKELGFRMLGEHLA